MNARMQELLPETFWRDFGRRILVTAIQKGKRRVDLARHLNCTPSHISKMVKTGSVSLPAAAAISMYLNVQLDALLFGNHTRIPAADDPQFIKQFREWMRSAPAGVKEIAAEYRVNSEGQKSDPEG